MSRLEQSFLFSVGYFDEPEAYQEGSVDKEDHVIGHIGRFHLVRYQDEDQVLDHEDEVQKADSDSLFAHWKRFRHQDVSSHVDAEAGEYFKQDDEQEGVERVCDCQDYSADYHHYSAHFDWNCIVVDPFEAIDGG